MASPATLPISDPECVLFTCQQVITFRDKIKGIQLVADVDEEVYPSKAKIKIVFKNFCDLPTKQKRKLEKGFRRDESLDQGASPCKLFRHSLQTQSGPFADDQEISLSLQSQYKFPLVKSLEYDIYHLLSSDGLSEEERQLFESVKSVNEIHFPNVTAKSESVTYIGGSISRPSDSGSGAAAAGGGRAASRSEEPPSPAAGSFVSKYFKDRNCTGSKVCKYALGAIALLVVVPAVLIQLAPYRFLER